MNKRTGKPSQNEMILAWLKQGRSITPLDALNEFGCFRLGARIGDLRKRGYNIGTQRVARNGKHYASYTLAKSQQEGQA